MSIRKSIPPSDLKHKEKTKNLEKHKKQPISKVIQGEMKDLYDAGIINETIMRKFDKDKDKGINQETKGKQVKIPPLPEPRRVKDFPTIININIDQETVRTACCILILAVQIASLLHFLGVY